MMCIQSCQDFVWKRNNRIEHWLAHTYCMAELKKGHFAVVTDNRVADFSPRVCAQLKWFSCQRLHIDIALSSYISTATTDETQHRQYCLLLRCRPILRLRWVLEPHGVDLSLRYDGYLTSLAVRCPAVLIPRRRDKDWVRFLRMQKQA